MAGSPADFVASDALDAADPLAGFRERFAHPDRELLYMDGNSLGAPPLASLAAVHQRLDEWRERLVEGWAGWIELPERIGDRLGAAVLGAGRGQVVISDSTTVNLYKLADAAITARPGRTTLVVDEHEFPTDRYVLEGLADRHGLTIARELDERAALLVRSHVDYRSGELRDMAADSARAHAADALALWDCSHSAGVVPVALDRDGADLAVGCTYKYLSAGPGAPAFLYVRTPLVERLRSPIQGWFGQRDQFAMGAGYQPEPGVARFLTGTPNVLDLTSLEAAVELVCEAGIERIRAKSEALTAHALALADRLPAGAGFTVATPRAPERRGGHLALRHPDAWRICRALVEQERVIPDFREPDILRLGMPPLTTRFRDVHEALSRTARVVAEGRHLGYSEARLRVT